MNEFPLDPNIIYLNHAAVAPWPQRTRDAVLAFSDQNIHQGAADYPTWLRQEHQLRRQLKTLIHAASVDEIALVKNTSEALSFIAYGLNWQPGDQVLTSDEEFPSNMIPWESLSNRGVEVIKVNLHSAEDPTQALIDAMTAQTRLLSISSVQYASGVAVDLNRLGAACQSREILYCIDAIQSLGAFPFDVQANQADFVVADGHKWMLGPEGLGLFYCRKSRLDTLSLNEYGWHMVEAMGQYDRDDWQVAQSARRFECGSPNMLGIHALSASLSLILELGLAQIAEQIQHRTEHIRSRIAEQSNLHLVGNQPSGGQSGIVVFTDDHADHAELHRYLMANGVICALRGGGIRFSPHFYTPIERIDRAFDYLSDYRGS